MAARPALKRFGRNQSGATAVEVGLLVAGLCIAIISAVSMLSGGISTSFTKTSTAMSTANSGS
ncbi:MAG: pilin [Caulobacter sp. 12-67-6]|nr:MAG: pilin [Caulobacter sp. 12-67-6]OYX71802.1 MAG: pilin [Caulobacter sp. 32-67-35]OYX94477.1 MAG: pilin [Caulobacter sp. 35-67-4]OZA80054.1 MAG: pilin [Caulobacter sp. 39-67-4]HQR88556.1 Flp family type IVb pilin [Caulobacter sp.]